MATQNQDRLRTHFSSLETTPTAQGSGWDTLWETATFLPWDRGYANPALIDLLSSSLAATPSAPPTSTVPNPTPGAPPLESKAAAAAAAAIPFPTPLAEGQRKRVLVPGCGKGYDVALFSAYGFDAWGLEVSPHAARAAEEYLASAGPGALEGEYEGKDGGKGKGGSVCLVGDFFGEEWIKQTGGARFDVIYDNTFLCALPPALRPRWAKRISELLAPGGRLVCLEFPTHKPASSGGPPWSLPPTVHAELLKRPGEEISYDESGVVVATEREEGKGALVRVAHYTPARTHEVGVVKGVVRDSVSVWRHA